MSNWILKAKDIPLPDVARMTGYGQSELSQMLLTDQLGPAQTSKTNGTMPLFHLAALVTLQHGNKLGVPADRLREVLLRIAGAAYVRLALAEHAAGRCAIRSGTGARQLWNAMKAEGGKSVVEEQLPVAGLNIKRFAFFSAENVTFLDLEDMQHFEFEDSPRFIDTWRVASVIKQRLRGTLFWTESSVH